MSAGSDFPPSEPEPTRALLLAQALETCIQAERKVPGSADQIIARRPAWMRAELRRLVGLAGGLETVAHNAVMSDEFRVAARARIMRSITATLQPPDAGTPSSDTVPFGAGPDQATLRLPTPLAPSANGSSAAAPSALNGTARVRKRRSRWLWRGAIGGILAAVLATLATLSASASSLPGQPLYGIKQATEELGVRLAPDDQARMQMLLRQANARLDETAQLLDQGRTDQVANSTERFDEALTRATTTYTITLADAPHEADAPTTAELEAALGQQQTQLQSMLASAPQPARDELTQALVATERSRTLVADPKPADSMAANPDSSVAAKRDDSAPAAPTNPPTAARDLGASAPPSSLTDKTRADPTDAPSRGETKGPPPVDLVQHEPDVTPFVTSASASADDDQHEVDAQRAMETQTTRSTADPPAAQGRTPVTPSRGRRDPQPIQHLRIPALAPPPQVARAPSSDASNADGPSADAGRHTGAAQQASAGGPPRDDPPPVANDSGDDNVASPSPNQPDTRGHAADAPAPGPGVVAEQPAGSDAGNHSGGSGPSDGPHSADAGPPDANAPSANIHAGRDVAANPPPNASAGMPAPGSADGSASPPSTAPPPPDANHASGPHPGDGSPSAAPDPHTGGAPPAGNSNSPSGSNSPQQGGAASASHDHPSNAGGSPPSGSPPSGSGGGGSASASSSTASGNSSGGGGNASGTGSGGGNSSAPSNGSSNSSNAGSSGSSNGGGGGQSSHGGGGSSSSPSGSSSNNGGGHH